MGTNTGKCPVCAGVFDGLACAHCGYEPTRESIFEHKVRDWVDRVRQVDDVGYRIWRMCEYIRAACEVFKDNCCNYLSANLKPNTPCPVCGSLEHSQPAHKRDQKIDEIDPDAFPPHKFLANVSNKLNDILDACNTHTVEERRRVVDILDAFVRLDGRTKERILADLKRDDT